MKKLILLFFGTISIIYSYSQDTIFADPYPNGIISNNYTTSTLKIILFPVENADYRIVFNKSAVRNTHKADGTVVTNEKYKPNYITVLNTDPSTGVISYRDILTADTTSQEQLYLNFTEIQTSPSDDLSFRLISEDPSTKSALTYEVSFKAKYAGDDTQVLLTLSLYFKYGRAMYVLKDFYVVINYKKYGYGGFGWQSHQKSDLEKLEKYYPAGLNDDKEKFWKVISNNIKQIISIVDVQVTQAKNGITPKNERTFDKSW